MKMANATAQPTNTQMSIVTVAANQASGGFTQSTQSSQNQVVALNLPSISAVPMTMQMQGMNNMPIALCALNSQQPGVLASQQNAVSGTSVQALQTNTMGGGGIILLNVGGAGNNNLATAISQIVSGASLVQQPQVPVIQTVVPATTSIPQTTGNLMNTPQSLPLPSQFLGGNSQAVPTSQIPNMAANMHINGGANIGQMNYQPAMTLQTSMPAGNPPQIAMPGQQQAQAAPTAFMLVPIPQIPTVQTPVNSVNMHPASINLSQQQQQVLINQISGSVPSQTQIQNFGVTNMTCPGQAQVTLQKNGAVIYPQTNNFSQSSMVPKNDELKAFLTKETSISTHVSTPTVTYINPVVSTAFSTPQICQTSPALSSSTPTHSALLGQSFVPGQSNNLNILSLLGQQTPPMQSSSPLQYQPTVSSPGLAFLAQVSSLSAANQCENMTKKTHSTPTNVSNSVITSVSSTFDQEVPQFQVEVNNNIIKISTDELKSRDFLSEFTFATTASTAPSMTVSSTTKLGDEGIPQISENQTDQCQEFMTTETTDTETLPFQISTSITTNSTCNKKGVKEKRKKGPAPKLNGTEVCLICGDHASGFHYNILSCEGCKGFFRRSVIKGAKYICKTNGDCHIDLYMRRKCQLCRFKKCKQVGMKEESVLSEEQVKAKKLKKEADQTFFSPMRSISDDLSVPTLTPQQRNLVELLKANERRFQWPTTEDMKKVTAWVEEDDSVHSRALRFAHFTELCILIVQLVVEFTKQLPGFLTVLREDQASVHVFRCVAYMLLLKSEILRTHPRNTIVLLKACAIEVMLLRAAKQYNKHDGTINFLNGKLYNKSSFYRAGMQVEFVDPIFQFCNSMAQLDLDETEYAILVAINTFSTDRPHIKDIEKVECMQDPYVELLRVYSKIRHPNDPLMFARILMKIVELRTLNNYHSEQMFALKVQDRKLPPLLAEIWDM